jgi:hypothetical protein
MSLVPRIDSMGGLPALAADHSLTHAACEGLNDGHTEHKARPQMCHTETWKHLDTLSCLFIEHALDEVKES